MASSVLDSPFSYYNATGTVNKREIISLNPRLIHVDQVRVSNSWKEKYDESGWNDYVDNFNWEHTGPSYGWQVAEGDFIAAEGSYPDYSHPVWQKVLNETSS
jgi:hypothetical protein